MPDAPLGYWDYVKAAFARGHRVPGMGRMPLNQMGLLAFAVLGVANPGFWFLGAAAELAYLGTLSSNPRFQRLVQGERLEKRQQSVDTQVRRNLAALDPESHDRYRRLHHECRQILGLAPARNERELGSLSDMRAGGLNQLLSLFQRLLMSRRVISTNLSTLDAEALEADVARLAERLKEAGPDTPLARSLQATHDIQTKRLANLARAKESLVVIDAELTRIEQQVRLIREETAVSGGPEVLSARLDAVTATLDETSKWMDQNAEILGSLTDDLDAGGQLPRLLEPEPEAPPRPPPPPRGRRQRN